MKGNFTNLNISFNKLVPSKSQIEFKTDDISIFYDGNTANTNVITLNPKTFTNLETIKIGSSKAKPIFTDEIKTSCESFVKYADFLKCKD